MVSLKESLDDDENDVYAYKPTKPAPKARSKRAPAAATAPKTAAKRSLGKKLTEKQLREQRLEERAKREMEEQAKEFESVKNYKLIVEHVDHDY